MYQEDNANLNDEFMLNEYARYINLCLYDKLWETLEDDTKRKNLQSQIDNSQKDNKLTCKRANEELFTKSIHGTTNALIENMIIGVSKGYTVELETVGVGYRFQVTGKQINVSAGFSHPVVVDIPEGITVEAPSTTELKLSGIDKQKVTEFAANIRKIRKPEPYKGKGIRYVGEHIRRKEGKKAK